MGWSSGIGFLLFEHPAALPEEVGLRVKVEVSGYDEAGYFVSVVVEEPVLGYFVEYFCVFHCFSLFLVSFGWFWRVSAAPSCVRMRLSAVLRT